MSNLPPTSRQSRPPPRGPSSIAAANAVTSSHDEGFRALAESIPQIVFAADQDGALEYVNGRGKEYAGLWHDVAAYTPPKPHEKLPPLAETAEVPSLVSAMVKLDRTLDRLKLCQKAGWAAPKDHMDLTSDQETLLVEETLHETRRNLAADREASFRDHLEQCESLAGQLRRTLKTGPSDRANADFSALQNSCIECHARYRN